MSALSSPTCGCSFLLSGTLTATAACLASAGVLISLPVSGHRGRLSTLAVGLAVGVVVVGVGVGAFFGLSPEQPATAAAPATPRAPSNSVRRSTESITCPLPACGGSSPPGIQRRRHYGCRR